MGTLYFVMPWFLVGMITLAIPFLLLLTKAKTMRVTNFSSVLFLRSITEKASNVIQWKRLLLLLTRLLMFFALTAAFSLPFLNRRGGLLFLGRVQAHLVFVLDNSYSMGYIEGEKTLFETAKDKIGQLAHENKKGKTWFSFYTFNTHLEAAATKATDRTKWLNQVRDTALSAEGTSYSQLLAEMKEKIPVDPDIPTKVFILSDFSVREAQFKNDLEPLFKSWCDSCKTQLIPVQPKEYRNFSIQSVILPPHFFVPNVEEEIRVAYQAFNLAGQEAEISLWMDQTQVATQKVVIPESGKGVALFHEKFPAAGTFPIRVQAGPDAVEADNVQYALIHVHEPLRVLLIEDQDYQYPFDSPYYYFTQVLESGRSDEMRSWIDIAKTSLSSLGEFKLGQYNLVVMADVANLGPKEATQLRYYQKDGGSILFALGKNFEGRKDLNSNNLTQFLGGIFGDVLQASNPEAPFRIAAVDYSHPLFRIFDSGKRGDLSSLRFLKAISFTPQEKTEYSTPLWFEGKQPALIEMKREKGLLFLWNSSLNQAWTDFPKQSLYVPFIFELVKYAALRNEAVVQNLKAGERLIFDEKGTDLAKPVTLKNPKNEEITIYRDKQGAASIKADLAGFYQWINYTPAGIEKIWAAVNVNTEESKPAYVEIKREAGAKDAKAHAKAAGEGLAVRFFIYRPFLYLVLAMLLLEAWLANRFYKPSVV